MSTELRAMFLDAGNTLLFPQLQRIEQDLQAAGVHACDEQFHEAERAGKRKLDQMLWLQIREGRVPRSSNGVYWEYYLDALFEQIRVPAAARKAATDVVVERFRDIRTWSKVLPETIPVLESLRSAGYFLAVISNSDGTVEGELRRAGLRKYLEFVIDSSIVGVEKPHPEIFEIALERAGIEPQEVLYVGDTYATDIGGAQLAGLRGVLMDRVGAYPDAKCPSIKSLSELGTLIGALRS